MTKDLSAPELLAYVRTISPLIILGVPLVFSTRPLKPVRNFLGTLLPDLVPYDTLVPPSPPTAAERATARKNGLTLWRQLIFVGLGLVEAAVWMAVVGSHIVNPGPQGHRVVNLLLEVGMVVIWVGDLARARHSALNPVIPLAQTRRQDPIYPSMVFFRYLPPPVDNLARHSGSHPLHQSRNRRSTRLGDKDQDSCRDWERRGHHDPRRSRGWVELGLAR
jgi:hypothetical protein